MSVSVRAVIVQRIELDRAGFACALGGPDSRTVFMLAAEWDGIDNVDEAIARRTGQVLTVQAPASGIGWPCQRRPPLTGVTPNAAPEHRHAGEYKQAPIGLDVLVSSVTPRWSPMSPASRGTSLGPWKVRYPAAHVSSIGLVVVAEEPSQRGLLVADHEQVKCDAEDRRPAEQVPGLEQESGSDHDRQVGEIHRVAHDSVGAAANDEAGRIDRCQRASSLVGEAHEDAVQQ